MLGLRFSPVYPPIFICVFAVALFFVTILFATNKPRKPGAFFCKSGIMRSSNSCGTGESIISGNWRYSGSTPPTIDGIRCSLA